jgi:hypothetical protein
MSKAIETIPFMGSQEFFPEELLAFIEKHEAIFSRWRSLKWMMSMTVLAMHVNASYFRGWVVLTANDDKFDLQLMTTHGRVVASDQSVAKKDLVRFIDDKIDRIGTNYTYLEYESETQSIDSL